jgi:ferric iron reductase protein FhuF
MPFPSAEASDALSVAGGVGPYFETSVWREGSGWRSLSELTQATGAMAERVAAATSGLARISGTAEGDLEPRVVASTVSLGLFARLVAPPLAAVVLTGVLPHWSVDSLWWQPVAGGPWPLAVSDPHGRPAGLEESAELFGSSVVEGTVGSVVRAVQAEFSVSEQVLWGNVASALAGAMTMLVAAHPERADTTAGLVERLLEREPLSGTGEVVHPEASDPRRFFVRRSCCLFYRVPGGGYCGDCVLTPSDVRRQQWRSTLSQPSP